MVRKESFHQRQKRIERLIGPLIHYEIKVKIDSDFHGSVFPAGGWRLDTSIQILMRCCGGLDAEHVWDCLRLQDRAKLCKDGPDVTLKMKCPLCNRLGIVNLLGWRNQPMKTGEFSVMAEIAISGFEPVDGANNIKFGESLVARLDGTGTMTSKEFLLDADGAVELLFQQGNLKKTITGVSVQYSRIRK